MGWRNGRAVVAMAAVFLVLAFTPMASLVAAEDPAAVPTGGVVVNSQTSGDQINPRTFVGEDGRIYVVWEEVASGVSRIFFSMSEDGGATFHTRTRVDNIAQGTKCLAKTPVVVVNSTGSIFVAWSDNRTGTYQVYFSSSNDGDHFSSNAMVAPTGTWVNQTLPDMDLENDNIFLTWSEQQLTAKNNTYIRFTYSTNSGSSFRSPIRMDTVVDVIQLYPSLSVKGSKVVVAWHDSRDNPLFDIRVAVSTNNGQTFPTNLKVSTGGAVSHWYPSAEVLPDGRIFVAWQQRDGGDFDIYGTISTTNDQTYSSPGLLVGGEHDETFISTAVEPRGIVWLAFRGEQDGQRVIKCSRSNDGISFAAPIVIDPNPGSEQAMVDVGCDGNGTAYFVYQDDGLGTEDVLCSRMTNDRPLVNIIFPVTGQVWPRMVNMAGDCSDPDTSPVMQVQVQIKEVGGPVVMAWTHAVVVNKSAWNLTIDTAQFDNGQYQIFARSFDGAAYSLEDQIEATFDNGIQPFVDLSIASSDITFSPQSPVEGNQVTITAEVSNLGNTDAENVQVQFHRGSASLGTVTVARVAAGAKSAALMSWSALEGTFEFRATVDPEDLFEEPNEGNNVASATLAVGPLPEIKPDLEISAGNITWSPSVVHVGDVVSIAAKVSNVGRILVNDVKVEFQVDSQYLTYRWTGQINPGEFYIVQANWTATVAGAHSFTVVVDPLPRQLDEERTNNNQATVHLTVYAENAFKPDLAISNATVSIQPSTPKIGQTITFAAIVSNLGDIPAEAVQVTFYVDGTLLGGPLMIPEINPGEAADITTTWTAAIGDRTLTVKVDEQDAIDEANESNNVVVRGFVVHPAQLIKPNLHVDAGNVSYWPAPPVRGEVLQFNVTVWNLGNDSASDIKVQLKIDGTQLDGILTIAYLEPGRSATVIVLWLPTGGPHTLEVILDPDAQISEWSTDDNTAEISVDLPADPMDIPWVPILAIVAFAVLGYGIYAYMGKRKRGKAN